MSRDERARRIARLRRRDLDVVRAFIANPGLKDQALARLVGLSLSNVKKRMQAAYDVLDVSGRAHLFAEYHSLLLEERPCDCARCPLPSEGPAMSPSDDRMDHAPSVLETKNA